MSDLYARIAELAEKYRPLGAQILKEAIRIPADHDGFTATTFQPE